MLGGYDVKAQHWQQNYSPPADFYERSNPPPRLPSPLMIQRGPSLSSVGSENMLSSPSPVIPLGFSKSTFSYDELAMSTNNFSEANVLGEGDYGCVHKGVLPNGKEIVVKSIKSCNGKRQQEFQEEVEIISRVHHKHVVYLVGYCVTESHWLLVYEFVPNCTMDFHLHEKGQPTMDWPSRLRIAKGTAKGLAYLHEDCHPKIIHGDIKASNILLNHKFEAKVADFGRAKVFSDSNTHVSTRVIGALGYLAPEYVASGKLSDKSDVFSFGVVLLELITGRRPSDSTNNLNESFVDWARPLLINFLEENNFESLVDPHLQNNYDRNEMARMIVCAAACVRHSARSRPQMSQVVRALDGEMSLSNSNQSLKREASSTYSSYPSSESEGGYYKEDKKTLRLVAVTSHASCSSEYDGTTSEYGMYPSGKSSELPSREMTRELERAKMKGDS